MYSVLHDMILNRGGFGERKRERLRTPFPAVYAMTYCEGNTNGLSVKNKMNNS